MAVAEVAAEEGEAAVVVEEEEGEVVVVVVAPKLFSVCSYFRKVGIPVGYEMSNYANGGLL